MDVNIAPIYPGPSRIPAGITIKVEGAGGSMLQYLDLLGCDYVNK